MEYGKDLPHFNFEESPAIPRPEESLDNNSQNQDSALYKKEVLMKEIHQLDLEASAKAGRLAKNKKKLSELTPSKLTKEEILRNHENTSILQEELDELLRAKTDKEQELKVLAEEKFEEIN